VATDVTRKVLRNAAFIFFGRLWFVSLSILLTPYLLSRLGSGAYGIWVLVDSLARTAGLMDMGFSTSFVKHVAEHDARGDREGVSGVLTTGVAFYAAVAFPMLALALFGVDVILPLFSVPEELQQTTRLVLRTAITASIFGNLMGVYHSVINGLQKMHVSNAIMVLMSVGYAVGCVVVLESGFGLVGLAVNQLLTQIVGVAASHRVARWIYPGLAFRPSSIKKHWSSLFRYGLNVHISNVASLINAHFDKLLVNRFIDAPHVAFYDVGSRPPATARSFAMVLLSSLTPATSELEVRSGKEALYELYTSTSRYVAVIAIPLFFGIAVTASPLIGAWLGSGYESSVVVMQLLCLGFLFYSLAGPVTPFVQGMGKPQYLRNAEMVSLALNVVLSLAFIVQYGFYGAPAGTAIAICLSSVYYLWSFHRFMNHPLPSFMRATYWKPTLCAFVSSCVAWVVTTVTIPFATASRPLMLLVVLLAGAAFGLVYVSTMVRSGYLHEEEVRRLRSFIPLERLFQPRKRS
jgi:O-antigen/teichoic acid export membrane protein